MPIHDSSYSAWEGRLLDRPMTWLIIARTGVRLVWSKVVAVLLFAASIPFLIRAGQIYVASRLSDEESVIDFAHMVEVRPDLFMNFMRDQMVLLLVLIAVVGAGLIANDRRFRALSLYFSRPVSFRDYVAGKFAVVLVYFGLVTVVPALLLYALQLMVTVEPGFFERSYWVPFSILAQGTAALAVLGSLMLAISSCTKSTRSTIVFFFAVLVVPAFIAELVSRVNDIGWISVTRNLHQISAMLYGVRTPYRYPFWAAFVAWAAVIVGSLVVLRLRIKPTEVVK